MKTFIEILTEMPSSMDIEGMTVTKRFFKNAKKKFDGDEDKFLKLVVQRLGMGMSDFDKIDGGNLKRRVLAFYKGV